MGLCPAETQITEIKIHRRFNTHLLISFKSVRPDLKETTGASTDPVGRYYYV